MIFFSFRQDFFDENYERAALVGKTARMLLIAGYTDRPQVLKVVIAKLNLIPWSYDSHIILNESIDIDFLTLYLII